MNMSGCVWTMVLILPQMAPASARSRWPPRTSHYHGRRDAKIDGMTSQIWSYQNKSNTCLKIIYTNIPYCIFLLYTIIFYCIYIIIYIHQNMMKLWINHGFYLESQWIYGWFWICLGLVCVYPPGPGQSQEKKTAVDCCCIPQTSRHGDYLIATL